MTELLSVRDFCERYACGRTRVYQLIRAGELDARKAGTRTLITGVSAQRWMEKLPALDARGAEQDQNHD